MKIIKFFIDIVKNQYDDNAKLKTVECKIQLCKKREDKKLLWRDDAVKG